ncbi:hypothetical protein [Phaeobacter gallaeciensis]|uniref:hypothetical protein n=1 Tax=Phaeobacter gallaeciensis TaxID=60890 RepID=UPI00237F9C8F|nr:hypothetical protein [Phaeobacter gallaeciensis]MDE4059788.1 hypothetical protein [Phaeobacter gallaeciensis]MDE4122575.1 hypothetical protein [Phaeobacter gallaeciensis]MDE4127276.1 hypothetical protein [Phaeobacter gallaeciensis]
MDNVFGVLVLVGFMVAIFMAARMERAAEVDCFSAGLLPVKVQGMGVRCVPAGVVLVPEGSDLDAR